MGVRALFLSKFQDRMLYQCTFSVRRAGRAIAYKAAIFSNLLSEDTLDNRLQLQALQLRKNGKSKRRAEHDPESYGFTHEPCFNEMAQTAVEWHQPWTTESRTLVFRPDFDAILICLPTSVGSTVL